MSSYYSASWATVKCPVCGHVLGSKRKDEIKSFICETEGCSKTEHTFYPGQVKRPGKSKPWSVYYHKKSHCGCPSCEARRKDD